MFCRFLHDGVDTMPYPTSEVQIILNHIRNIWCPENEQLYTYVLKWFSKIAQRGKNRTLLYSKSGQGSGKSSITEFIREHVLGSNNTRLIDNPNDALGDFNNILEDVFMAF